MSCDAAMTQTCHHRPNSATAPHFAVLPGKGQAPQDRGDRRHAEAGRHGERLAARPAHVGGQDGRRRLMPVLAAFRGGPPGPERINGPVAPLQPECLCLPGRTSGCGQAVENSIPDPRKPSKTESGLDSKHGCFPLTQEGRLPHYPFRGLLGVHSRSGLPAL